MAKDPGKLLDKNFQTISKCSDRIERPLGYVERTIATKSDLEAMERRLTEHIIRLGFSDHVVDLV